MKIANGQKMQEKVFNILKSSEKFNPNYIDISPHANQHGNYQEISHRKNKYQNKLVRMWRGEFIYWL
jgi:hypothetical protein